MSDFSELGLSPALLRAVEKEGYSIPTPIQAQAIPPLLRGADLLGIAQTGTGKTAAFALPILQRLAADAGEVSPRRCRALILAPTRELASQIGESFRTYGRHLTLKVAVVFGGVSHRPQIDALNRGVDILVATPGRLIDHMIERNVSLAETGIFVLDEADQMLDLGFLPAIKRIVRALPAERQNLFFSATMPGDIARLADELLREPVRVSVARVGTAAEKVSQRVIHIEHKRKSALLAELLASPEMRRTLVFTRTKRGADKVARHLATSGISSGAIHGNKSQRQRELVLEAFRGGECGVLVATDIAARGIDIDCVTHVVNYDLPEIPEAYVHRIGRTARAGAHGEAIAFCDPEERGLLRAIQRLIRQTIPADDRCGDPTLTPVAVPESRQRDREHPSRSRTRPRTAPTSNRSKRHGASRSDGRTTAPSERPVSREGRSSPSAPRAIEKVPFLQAPHGSPSGGSSGRDRHRPSRGPERPASRDAGEQGRGERDKRKRRFRGRPGRARDEAAGAR